MSSEVSFTSVPASCQTAPRVPLATRIMPPASVCDPCFTWITPPWPFARKDRWACAPGASSTARPEPRTLTDALFETVPVKRTTPISFPCTPKWRARSFGTSAVIPAGTSNETPPNWPALWSASSTPWISSRVQTCCTFAPAFAGPRLMQTVSSRSFAHGTLTFPSRRPGSVAGESGIRRKLRTVVPPVQAFASLSR